MIGKGVKNAFKILALLFLLSICGVSSLSAQTPLWSNVLSPSRATNYTVVGVPGGIPSRSVVWETIPVQGSVSVPVSPSAINAAIASCPANEVVQLAAGNFYLNSGIDFANHSNCTLRGAGADQTFLYFSGDTGCFGTFALICIENNQDTLPNNIARYAQWNSGYTHGATTIPLSYPAWGANQTHEDAYQIQDPNGYLQLTYQLGGCTTGSTIPPVWNTGIFQFTTGDGGCTWQNQGYPQIPTGTPIILDQCGTGLSGNTVGYLGTGPFTQDNGCGTGTVTDNGAAFICTGTPDVPADVCTAGGTAGGYRGLRFQTETHSVAGCTPTTGSNCTGPSNGPYTITLDRGVDLPNWAIGSSPEAWWPITYVVADGIENMSVDSSGIPAVSSGSHRNFSFEWSSGSWLLGVRSVYGLNSHTYQQFSVGTTIANNYFYGSDSVSSGGYGISDCLSSATLDINNVFQHVTAPYASDCGSTLAVHAYNYETNPAWYQGTTQLTTDEPHAAGAAMQLFESNIGSGFDADDIHGTANWQSLFRNWYQASPTGGQVQGAPIAAAVQFWAYARYGNILGNILGTSIGATGTYQHNSNANCSSIDPFGSNNPIFSWGCLGNAFSYADSKAFTTSYRWDNYDVVNGSAQCNNSEVPTADAFYPNFIPTSCSIPNSIFLFGRPSFYSTLYGTPVWPTIGPDVSGTIGPGNHVNKLPAELVFDNAPVDTTNYGKNYTITGGSCTSGVVSLTVAINDAFASYPSGQILLTGAGTGSFANGTAEMTGTYDGSGNLSSLKYMVPSCSGSWSGSGTVGYPRIRKFNASTYYNVSGSTSPPSGLTGSNGGSAGAHTVVLTWNPSSTSGSTYFIFRGSTSGGENTQLNMSGVGTNCTGPTGGCTYTDSSIVAGQTWFYEVEASFSGSPSTPSNEFGTNVPVSAPTNLTITGHN